MSLTVSASGGTWSTSIRTEVVEGPGTSLGTGLVVGAGAGAVVGGGTFIGVMGANVSAGLATVPRRLRELSGGTGPAPVIETILSKGRMLEL